MFKQNLFHTVRQSTTPITKPSYTRNFHATTANMVVNAYFEVTWNGPKLECDKDGKVTTRDNDIKGELLLLIATSFGICHHPTSIACIKTDMALHQTARTPSTSSCLTMSSLRRSRTSVPCAPARRVSVTLAASFTV